MELTPTVQMLRTATIRLNESSKEIFRLAKKKAETERTYHIELAKVMMRMRSEGVPVTILGDLARGEVAGFRFERDLAAETYRAALASMEALKTEVNALQSIAKYQSDIGG